MKLIYHSILRLAKKLPLGSLIPRAIQMYSVNLFFIRIKRKPAEENIRDELSIGLTSRNGESSFKAFQDRINRYWPDYAKAWNEARKSRSFKNLPKAIRCFINSIKSDDIVDNEYPLFKTIGNPKNSFLDVRLLKSLAVLCANKKKAHHFLYLLALEAPADPLNYLNFIALAQLLAEKGDLRKAADCALEARRLRAFDLCLTKTIVKTQKALLVNGMTPDIEQTNHDFRDHFCVMPFKLVNVFSYVAGEALNYTLCPCPAWAPLVFDSNFSWNSPDAQEFRRSILDGSFRYCDDLICPHLIKNNLPRRADIRDSYFKNIIDNPTLPLEHGPEEIVLAYDRSCNLSCPSCRDKIYVADQTTTDFYNKTMDVLLPPLLSTAKTLKLSQTGEALASPHFRHLLKSITPSKYPNLKITLLTNLKLISKETWDDLGETADLIKNLHLSIDGATPQTLEKLRRGIKWERILNALNFIRNLQKMSKIEQTHVNFIIQKDNFRELPEMLQLCSNNCLNILTATRIRSHGSYTNDQFRDIDVGDSAHPLHGEYLDAINQTKALHKLMKENASTINASGRSVPVLSFNAI